MALTLRNIDEALRAALEREAGVRGLTLNALIIELCRSQLGFAPAGLRRHYDLDAGERWTDDEAAAFWSKLASVRGSRDSRSAAPGFPHAALEEPSPVRQGRPLPRDRAADRHTVEQLKTSLELLGRRRLTIYQKLQEVLDEGRVRIHAGRKRPHPSSYERAKTIVEEGPPVANPRFAGPAAAMLWGSFWSASGEKARRPQLVLTSDAYAAYRRGCPITEELLATTETFHLDAVTLAELHTVCLAVGAEPARALSRFCRCPRLRVTPAEGDTALLFSSLAHWWASKNEHEGGPQDLSWLWPAACAMQLGGVVLSHDMRFRSIPGLLVLPDKTW